MPVLNDYLSRFNVDWNGIKNKKVKRRRKEKSENGEGKLALNLKSLKHGGIKNHKRKLNT